MGEERWRRGVEERRALSSLALIIQQTKPLTEMCMDAHVNVVTKTSGARLSAQTQFYSLNMKSGKTSHCEQTDGNKKKENIMCFSSQRMTT